VDVYKHFWRNLFLHHQDKWYLVKLSYSDYKRSRVLQNAGNLLRDYTVTTQKAVNLHYHQEKFISCTYYYPLMMTVVSYCKTINYIPPQKMYLKQLTPLKTILLFFDHYFNFQFGNHISKMGSSSVSSCKGYAENPTLLEPYSEVPTPWT
jgi:hypothetical protein